MNPVSPRPYVTALIFTLAFAELAIMAFLPQAAATEAFKSIATMTFTGGPIGVAGFYFGGAHRDPPPGPPA